MAENVTERKAILQSTAAPTEEQRRRLSAFIKRNYNEEIPLKWQETPDLSDGFRLYVGQDVYDWSMEGRMRQFHERMSRIDPGPKNILPLIRSTMKNFTPGVVREELGEVLSVGDEIARVKGLPNAEYGEILEFAGGVRGMVQDLREDSIGVVLFDDDGSVTAVY